jgi:two-component system, sensor histidine kinase and response regulator
MLSETDRSLSGAASEAIKARVLVVDDEPAQMRALCETLKVEGYEARGCTSPRQALRLLEPGKFELLICGLMIAEMDGSALSSAAHRIDPALGSILMADHATVDAAVRAMQDGALDFVVRPFRPNVMLAAIARALETQRLRRELARLRDLERQKSAELELATRDLQSYSYSISHDLRAPLRAIDSFGQILVEEHGQVLNDDAKRLLGIMRSSCAAMDRLIAGLLEFSRAASGTRSLSMDTVDMTALAEVAAREARILYPNPDPKIEIGDLPEVMGDGSVLRQVWCNLIGNALKYSGKRPEPRVIITGHIEGDEAVYQVRDNGAGFDMRYADKLFGVFQRLHRAEEFAGVGVGLAVAQRIIAQHAGRIWAQSIPNEGACFRFALPLARAGAEVHRVVQS